MSKDRLVIIDGVRTPFCKAGGHLAALGADELGRVAVQALLTRTGVDPELIDETIIGCVAQPLEAGNVARVIALRAGLPHRAPALTVHRNCASGFEALTHAYEKMCAGQGSVFVVGGAESMSNIPLLYPREAAPKFQALGKARSPREKVAALGAFRIGDIQPRHGLDLALRDPYCGLNMGQTAERIAREMGVTRELQDAFAVESHRRAVAAHARRAEEIAPVFVPPDFARVVAEDHGPRTDTSVEALAKLPLIFEPRTGTITAGNASPVTDGAVALLAMSEKRAAREGLDVLGILAGYSHAGCDPARMGLGPVYAMARLERETGRRLDQADLVEINEAFAAQVLACLAAARSPRFAASDLGRAEALGEIPSEILNVNGGALALGHPVGASGSRLVLTALKELRRRKAKCALVSACVGGGQGTALWLEAP